MDVLINEKTTTAGEAVRPAESNERITVRVSVVSIIMNTVLAGFKLLAGILAHSGAMVADAVHSASDVAGSLIVIAGARMAGKEEDKRHPYGHERMECLASLILANILLAVGVGIGFKGVQNIMHAPEGGMAIPGVLALVAAVVSIAVKEGLFWYTVRIAKKIDSVSLTAEAWHHRSDALSSVGSLVGIAGARMGFPILDPVASIVICLFIFKVAVDVYRETMNKLLDCSCDDAVSDDMRALILASDGVMGVDDIKTRMFGSRIYVDVEIAADGRQTLQDSHAIAERVHDEIEKEFPRVKHCMVHVNPAAEIGGKRGL